MRVTWAKIFAAVFLLGGLAARPGSATPSIWFCPMEPLLRPETGFEKSPQYMGLFNPDAPWRQAAAQVQVFKIYPKRIASASDEDLRRQFADLKRRHIALALEYGVLSETGASVEGFGGENTLKSAQRIARLGGTLSYIAMDEPFYFANVFKGPGGPQWTIEQVAANAAANLKPVLAAYPQVKIGDIEPLGTAPLADVVKAYGAGWKALTAAGIPMAFFDADLDWNNPVAFDTLKVLRAAAKEQQLPFGIIYDGNPDSPTDAAWLQAAQDHARQAEAAVGVPDIVIFQSWHPHPVKLMPDTDADAFTHLIHAYVDNHGANFQK